MRWKGVVLLGIAGAAEWNAYPDQWVPILLINGFSILYLLALPWIASSD